jgi:hypothetical protein
MAAKGQFSQRLGLVRLGLAALFTVLALGLTVGPVLAQFYEQRRGGGFGGFFGPFQGQRFGYGQPAERQDFSHAPSPRKLENTPASTVLILGDAMADWLAYGLEDAMGDTPDYGVVRKNRATAGLIRYDTRNEALDWAAVTREAIAAIKPKFIVMMIGLNDRTSLRDKVSTTSAASGAAASPAKPAAESKASPESKSTPEAKSSPEHKPAAHAENPPAEPADAEEPPGEKAQPAAPAAQKGTPATTVTTRYNVYEFHTDEWAEAYARRIDATIAALKSAGVPVFWVGLPSIRGPKSTADMVYLNDLYSTRAERAGITYIDIWDGFVDESGHFTLHGPDFEGQTRRLRTSDGVYFTKAGARKLAHYLEREIQRVSLPGSEPVALPAGEPAVQAPAPSANAKPGGAVARPLSGPAVPLTASIAGADKLVGAGSSDDQANPRAVTRVLVKGDPVAPPAGRSDDFQWPRRTVAPFGTDPIVATTTEPVPVMKSPQETTVAAPAAETRPVTAAAPAPKRTTANNSRPAPYQQQRNSAPSFFSFFR